MTIRITCIKKAGGNHSDPHEGITELGWVDEGNNVGRSMRSQIVDFIEKGNKAYVKDGYGNIAYVGVVDPTYRSKYLRTYADGKWTDNLLKLIECRP